ncbi:MAG: hypothetical protein OXU96_00695 [Gammaproteobacteria bacterium]|nr:hypothetical protein [Gammaproteobacteria bacterium]
MPVDAMQVWSELADECSEAKHYYVGKDIGKDAILERGAADFDQKCFPDDKHEGEHYRTDYYVSRDGYMNMHIEQNLVALRHCFKGGIPQPVLFVDFGCGPMTSGLALAEVLSGRVAGYKRQVAYFGVDASRNMVNKAKIINKKHALFAPELFAVKQRRQFNPQEIPDFFPKPRIAVLCLSFVLARNTLQTDIPQNESVRTSAVNWKEHVARETQCRETRIIYLNPVGFGHANWQRFFRPVFLNETPTGGLTYTENIKLKGIPVEYRAGYKRRIALGMIRGTRK